MSEAGLPAPEYRQNEFMVYATIKQHGDVVTTEKTTEKVDESNLNGKELARSWQRARRGLQCAEDVGRKQTYCNTIITKAGRCVGVGWPWSRLIL